MPTDPQPGEVCFANLGLAEKSRPVLVLASPRPDDARALAVVAPLTSQIRGLRGEVPLGKLRWLPKVAAVNVQGLASFDPGKLARRLGTLSAEHYGAVKAPFVSVLTIDTRSAAWAGVHVNASSITFRAVDLIAFLESPVHSVWRGAGPAMARSPAQRQ